MTFVALFAGVCFVGSFVLTGVTAQSVHVNCPTSSHTKCVCTRAGVIDCEAKLAGTLPTFTAPSIVFHTLNLGNNSLTTLSASAFASLNVSTLLLNDNRLTTAGIPSTAFSGLERSLQTLDISNNQIHPLPQALAKLEILASLDVSGNPMNGYHLNLHRHTDDFTDNVMRELGDSLTRFKFGDPYNLRDWPKGLYHLVQLQELDVAGSAIYYLPTGAFHGFEQTLKSLTISNAAMSAIPLGISFLSSLKELHIDHMRYPFNDDSVISAPFADIGDTLEILSLNDDQLTVFPEVIKDLTHLHNLSLDGNDLQFISDEAISLLKKSNVSILSLKDCNLKRVPGAISSLRYLLHLDLSENIIRSIETTDLQDLRHLTTLSLAKNPLRYISDTSLCNLTDLTHLDLYGTNLTDISQAFKNLVNIEKMDVRQSKIDCTCDMWWMLRWQNNCTTKALEIEGQCETIYEDIQDFIVHRLPQCLDFQRRPFLCGSTCV